MIVIITAEDRANASDLIIEFFDTFQKIFLLLMQNTCTGKTLMEEEIKIIASQKLR